MAFLENTIERATALAATCGWLAFGGGAEAAVGVAIGGASLAALVSDAVRRHGPESEAALKSIRKRISKDLRAFAKAERWDNRTDLEAADSAMERALTGCFLDRGKLASSARSAEGFPGSATQLIFSKLAHREPKTFGEEGQRASQDYAKLVIRTALEAAIENEAYFRGLHPHLVMEMLRGIGTLEEKVEAVHEVVQKTHDLVTELHAEGSSRNGDESEVAKWQSELLIDVFDDHTAPVVSVVFFETGHKIASISNDWGLPADQQLAVRDISKKKATYSVLDEFLYPNSVHAFPHGKHLTINGHVHKGLSVFSAEGAFQRYIGNEFEAGSRSSPGHMGPQAHLHHEGMIAVVDRHEFLHVYDFQSGKLLGWLKPFWDSIVTALAFSPDGEEIAICGSRGQVTFWNLDDVLKRNDIHGQRQMLRSVVMDRQPTASLRQSSKSMNAIEYLRNGSVVTGGVDGAVRIWDREALNLKGILCRHSWHVNALTVIGEYVISVGAKYYDSKKRKLGDGEIKISNLESVSELLTINAHSNGIYEVAASPNGQVFATAGGDGKVMIWDMSIVYDKFPK